MESVEVEVEVSVRGKTEKTPQKEIEEVQIQDDSESGSFTSAVNYPYNLAEVAFLVYKLHQLIERKFKSKQRVLTLRRFVQRRSKESKKRDNMKLILDIENITRMQELQLNLGKVLKSIGNSRPSWLPPPIMWTFFSLFLHLP